MLVNDTNFVTPVFNEIKPEINVDLVSPLNFSKIFLQSNVPQVNQSTMIGKKVLISLFKQLQKALI